MNKKNLTCTRVLEFDSGHRVVNHESKCATLHGHRYKIEITAQADDLDAVGRIIDFSVLKARIGTWLDDHWDHTCILFKDDEQVIAVLKQLPRYKEPYIADFNPTAENMAAYLLNTVCPKELADTGVTVTKIVVWETPNCKAEASL